MNPVNSKKLLLSKWTAIAPQNRQKHFIVTEVLSDEAGFPRHCVLEAVHSHQEIVLDWQALADCNAWRIGWV